MGLWDSKMYYVLGAKCHDVVVGGLVVAISLLLSHYPVPQSIAIVTFVGAMLLHCPLSFSPFSLRTVG